MNNNNEYDIKFIILSLIFCTASVLLNIYCMKVLAVKTFVVGDCGIVVSWIIFLTNNLLTKNYGEKNTIKVIKVSNCIGFVVPVVSYLLTLLPTIFTYLILQYGYTNDIVIQSFSCKLYGIYNIK